jgi:hypothetical protein
MGFFAPLIGAAISGGLGMIGQKKAKGGGYDLIQPKWMPGMEALSGQASDYYANQLQRMREGREPEWWSKYAPVLKGRQMRGLEQAMYGMPGDRQQGAYSGQMQAGALAGLGAGQTTARTRPLYSEYLNKAREIDEAMAGMGAGIMQQGEQTYLQGINNMQKFQPMPMAMPVPQQPATQSPWASLLGNMAGSFIGGGGLNGLFGGAGKTPGISSMISSIGSGGGGGTTLKGGFESLNNPFSTGISWGGQQY